MASIPSDTVEVGSVASSSAGSDTGYGRPLLTARMGLNKAGMHVANKHIHNSSPMPLILGDAPASPEVSWMQESYLSTVNRYEQIATSMTGHEQLRHITKLPTLNTAADFLYTFNDDGTPSGSLPKSPTWPMTKDEASKAGVF